MKQDPITWRTTSQGKSSREASNAYGDAWGNNPTPVYYGERHVNTLRDGIAALTSHEAAEEAVAPLRAGQVEGSLAWTAVNRTCSRTGFWTGDTIREDEEVATDIVILEHSSSIVLHGSVSYESYSYPGTYEPLRRFTSLEEAQAQYPDRPVISA